MGVVMRFENGEITLTMVELSSMLTTSYLNGVALVKKVVNDAVIIEHDELKKQFETELVAKIIWHGAQC